ncbi:MAG: exosortase/archaeosortase family protein [Nitrososphaerota archaeon]|nr:exosortase/archaeosortase family protein [Nitrososphaerota archaeon]
MQIARSNAFVLALVAFYLAPIAIPRVGIDYPYFFIISLVLFAWFMIKWPTVKAIVSKGKPYEIALGGVIIAVDYAQNLYFGSRLGLLDMIFIFSALVFAFYGIRSFKIFWVPAMYGIVLLVGYQLEVIIPNFVALQDWMAQVMASSMRLLGVTATVAGHIVYLNAGSTILGLDVQGDCTGVQGILAFGLLSTMAVLDIKVKMSKLIPLFVIGFVGAFLINIVRLFGVFLSFEYLGAAIGTQVHVYLGYLLFIAWVMVFWSISFRYLMPTPQQMPSTAAVSSSVKPLK